MTEVNRSALVLYSADDMYSIVNDVGSYPDFLPWCSKTVVVSQTEKEMLARVYINYKGLHQSFMTRNTLTIGQRIDMELVDGPFSQFVGHWYFNSLGSSGSKISCSLFFEFTPKSLSVIASPIFRSIADGMLDAFCQRADELNGKN